MIKLLNLEPKNYSNEAKIFLEKFFEIHNGPLVRDQLKIEIDKYQALIVRLNHKIDREIIDCANNLQVIATATTGLNHIDIDYAQYKKIKIISLRDEVEFLNNIYATPEHTWALILSLLRNIPNAFNSVKENNWNRDEFKGRELNGRSIGIIGFGRVGKIIAKYAQAFNMNILVYTKEDYIELQGVNYLDDMKELLKDSDIVTLHLPLTSETKNFFSTKEFNYMKKDSFFINTSRGEIVNEEALIKSIKNNKISGAALDVIDSENDIFNKKSKIIEFAKLDSRLIITPHIAGATFESMEKIEIFIANKLANYFN